MSKEFRAYWSQLMNTSARRRRHALCFASLQHVALTEQPDIRIIRNLVRSKDRASLVETGTTIRFVLFARRARYYSFFSKTH